jgi:hypothetical protein
MAETEFITKTEILADLWLNYKGDTGFQDFIAYNDLGLPLAYMLANHIVLVTPLATTFIEETFVLLLAAMEIPEDEGFESLDDLFSI